MPSVKHKCSLGSQSGRWHFRVTVDTNFRLAANASVDAHCFSRSGRQSCEDTTEPWLESSCSWSCQPHLRSLILAECCLHLKEPVQRKNYIFLLSFFSLPSGKLLLFACGHQVLSLHQALKILWRVACGCLSHPRADSWPACL